MYIHIIKRTTFANIKSSYKFSMDQKIRYKKKRNIDMEILKFLHDNRNPK